MDAEFVPHNAEPRSHTRRACLAAVGTLALAGPAFGREVAPRIVVYRSSGCTCCEGWIRAVQRAGFATQVTQVDDVSPIWRRLHVPDRLSSCHLGLVAGYVTVGHVPPADIVRLLGERPRAIGLTVPGMPVGSPGMELPGVASERYQTLLLLTGGATRVFATHG